jgi:hypothetical protein
MNGALQSSKFDPHGNRRRAKKSFQLFVQQYSWLEDDGLHGLSEGV